MADRVVVMHEGTVSAVIERADFSEERIMRAAMGPPNMKQFLKRREVSLTVLLVGSSPW
jgi:ABC-type uncharacterized transport system ATPase subunit